MKSLLNAGWMFLLVVAFAACAPTAEEPAEMTAEAEAAEAAAETPVATPAAAPPASSRTAAQPATAPRPAAPAAPARRVFEVPSGTTLTFTLIDSLSTETSQPGDTFEASLTDALVIDGVTVIPRNAIARGRVLAVDEPGRVQGRARIELAMTDIRLGSQTVAIETSPFVEEAEGTVREDATKIGVGAGIGAAIGGILGGGGGAAKGAAIGGGAGTGVVLATRGDQIEYPSETRLSFSLSQTLRITEGNAS